MNCTICGNPVIKSASGHYSKKCFKCKYGDRKLDIKEPKKRKRKIIVHVDTFEELCEGILKEWDISTDYQE